jgi:hypothetical protein
MAMLSAPPASAQPVPFLERTLTISFNQERVDDALKKLSKQGGFTFSYNSSIFETERVINHQFVNKTVREILDQMFNGSLQYKVRGKYLILTKAPVSSSKKEQVLTGYVVDEATGERLRNVSIYDPVTLSSTITDSYGFFEIRIDKPTTDLRLAINKQNYTDTLVMVPSGNGRLLNIPIRINTDKIASLADSVGSKFKKIWARTKLLTKSKFNMVNIDDTIHRKFQMSFVPFIGTNHAMSGNVINDFSLNILGGYSLGITHAEFAGIFNMVRGNVRGFQAAGIFNAVGGDVEAFQLAGVFNANKGHTRGAKFAGIFNFDWEEVHDFSGAGVFNFARRGSRAVQLAGAGNLTVGDQKSPHVAGLFNFTTGDARSQFAGSYNFTGRDMSGWQAAGIFNFTAKNVKGVQSAGILNFAGKKMRGAQIAGILNYATTVHGTQVGLVNVADSVSGVPVGLLSVVMKGYHKIEIAADEIFYTNLSFRTGVRQFYNILTVGAQPATFRNDETLWTFGYGIGTAPRLSKKLFLNLDVTANQIMQGRAVDAVNLLNKVYLGVDFQMMKKLSLTAGATLNGYVTDNTFDGYSALFTDYKPHVFRNRDMGHDLNLKMWWGAKIGVRFL